MAMVSEEDRWNKTYEAFQQIYPEYEKTKTIDDLRAKDFSRLDQLEQVYLDYTGGGIYADFSCAQLCLGTLHFKRRFNTITLNANLLQWICLCS